MPAWSTDIAREFVRLADAVSLRLDQLQLQRLVYIAHGWCLAATGEPLTGDRPEAWRIGPIYRRMADLLGPLGAGPVRLECFVEGPSAELSSFEMDRIAVTLRDYGALGSPQLSSVTQGAGTPWYKVYADGLGEHRDIPHRLVREQFHEFAGQQACSQHSC